MNKARSGFVAPYKWVNDSICMIQHAHGGYLRSNPKNHEECDFKGGQTDWSKWQVLIHNQPQQQQIQIQIQNLKTKKYLEIDKRGRFVTVSSEGGNTSSFVVHKNSDLSSKVIAQNTNDNDNDNNNNSNSNHSPSKDSSSSNGGSPAKKPMSVYQMMQTTFVSYIDGVKLESVRNRSLFLAVHPNDGVYIYRGLTSQKNNKPARNHYHNSNHNHNHDHRSGKETLNMNGFSNRGNTYCHDIHSRFHSLRFDKQAQSHCILYFLVGGKTDEGLFKKAYLMKQQNTIIIRHAFDGSIEVNPENEIEVDSNGDKELHAQWEALPNDNSTVVQFRNVKSGAFLQIRDESVSCCRGKSDVHTKFKIHTVQEPNIVKLESEAMEGQFISVRQKGLCVGKGGPHCQMTLFRKN